MLTRFSILITATAVLFTFFSLIGSTIGHAAETEPWKKQASISASMTDVTTSRVGQYSNVTGLSGTDESFSWKTHLDATFKRRYGRLSQEHRINLRYGEIDGVENEDEIDLNNIGRFQFVESTFGYGTARVRSEFDTFGHPTVLNLSAGLGSTLLDSEDYGTLETRTGPRISREWNPHTDWESLYEWILEYELTFNKTNRFTSQLESYTKINDPDNYTVRWDNKLTASLNSWLDLRYTFTLYYDDPVGEVATKSVSTLNLVYHFYQGDDDSQ